MSPGRPRKLKKVNGEGGKGGRPVIERTALSFGSSSPGLARIYLLARKRASQQSASGSDVDSSASEDDAAEQAKSDAAEAPAGRGHRTPRPMQRPGFI